MQDEVTFLTDISPVPWTLDGAPDFCPVGLYVGPGINGLEVAVARSAKEPTGTTMTTTWKNRKGKRASPLLLVVLHSGKASLTGPTGETPPIYKSKDAGQIERLCRDALGLPQRHAALQMLSQALPSLETNLPGLINEGFLALHELEHGAPKRGDWEAACHKARAAHSERDSDLLQALGFRVDPLDNLTSILRSGDRRTALAVMLRESESAETGSDRFNKLSPVSYALKKADDENLDWVVMTQGNRIRLYPTKIDKGVGRRGRAETYIECQPSVLADEQVAYLWLIYSADALAENGSLYQLLDESQRFAGALAERLRERIYDHVVPELAQGIAVARGIERPTAEDNAHTYEMALTVLFRLLFTAYAEDRDLLPYRLNDAYRRRSLKQRAQDLAERTEKDKPIAVGDSHWKEINILWQAVADGNDEWGIPAYNGGLFADNESISQIGADLAAISLPNSCFETALRYLLVIETPEGLPGPVDFRSLGVREFGTIYEGLLESELAVAETDLVLEKTDQGLVYSPAQDGVTPEVVAGACYLHNRSGARKSSGSYYTKPFAVEHLLDGALEPALTDHFSRIDALDDVDAAKSFFDFRVADIAMGSGHFLIGAIDRIEKRMADYLAGRNLPGIRRELDNLRAAALNELGDLGKSMRIEDGQLLRRLIARRCIYGVDLNSIAVQLARLAVWIHTFIPGLPLSFLDHNLVHGNALIGIGTLAEIEEKLNQISFSKKEAESGDQTSPMFPVDAESLLGKAAEPLRRLANINDASLKEIATARAALEEARGAVRNTKALCDLISARHISDDVKVTQYPIEHWDIHQDNVDGLEEAQIARQDTGDLHVLHFPIAFPEVFLRNRPGFDVILGNPPWENVRVEKHAFWARHYPGLRSLQQREQETKKSQMREDRPDLVAQYEKELRETIRVRKALMGGVFPGIGTGDPDLYKAFCWRFWHLTATDGGQIGVVLPRSALSGKGLVEFRQTVFDKSARVDVTMLVNNREWIFPEVHPQYTIGLVCVKHGQPLEESIFLRGPYAAENKFNEGYSNRPATFYSDDVLSWSDSASLPLLPTDQSADVFAQIRKAPRLELNEAGQWRARPDRELDSTNDKKYMDLESEECPDGYWPVYKGASFNLWASDTHKYYAWAKPATVQKRLLEKRMRASRNKRSAHSEFPPLHSRDPSTLPCYAPRIAFRDVTRATDSRTVIACLVPPELFITDKGPYFLWPRGDEKDQAFLLGVLSSIPLDWYARRFVETSLAFFILNAFPIPRPDRDNVLWQRVIEIAGRLACPNDRFASWAEAVGVEHGPLADDEKDDMIFELDTLVACLYGLNESQLVHIYETFHEGWDYEDRLNGVLRYFREWEKEQ